MNNVETLKPFKHFCITIGALPTSYLESMSYYEMLCWFCKYLENTVNPAINQNAEALKELQEYVSNYFENLDVQEEINNKLDDMASSGELSELLTTYLEMYSVLSFDTVADLVSAENIIDGTTVKTLGYYEVNDGGGATYLVNDTSDTYSIALNDNLYAHIITDEDVNIKQFGCYGDGTHDDYNNLMNAISYAIDNHKNVYVSKGDYLISDNINITSPLLIYGNGTKNDETIIETTDNFTGDIIYSTASNYLKIRGITFKNNGTGNCITVHGENCEINDNHFIVNNGSCIKITGANTKLHDNQMNSSSLPAIIVSTSGVYGDLLNINTQIYNNYVAGTSNGIKVINENGHRIEGLFIHDNILVGTGEIGIEIQTGLYINISNNMLDGYTRLIYFVLEHENVDGIEINNNYLGNGVNHGLGIDITGTYYLTNLSIINNKAMNSTNFTNLNEYCSIVNISNNDIYGHISGDTGIGIYKIKNGIITGNKVDGFTNWIVLSDKDDTGNLIVKNNLYTGDTFKDMVDEENTLTMDDNRELI